MTHNVNASQNGRILDFQTLRQIEEDIDLFFEMSDCLMIVPKVDFRKVKVSDADGEDILSEEMPFGSGQSRLEKKKE